MPLPQLQDFDFQGKKVLVRCDLDVPLECQKSKGKNQKCEIKDETRIRGCLATIEYLLKNGASVILLGHLGRPQGKVVEELKMAPVKQKLVELLGTDNFTLKENLRFNPAEENNDSEFARQLASLGDFYVNEAFAVSHRKHASIVGIPKFLPHAAGLHFVKEVENLSLAREKPERPLVFIIGGAKPETKVAYLDSFSRMADTVLVGGTIGINQKSKINLACRQAGNQNYNSKVKNIIYSDLVESGLDIDKNSVKRFSEIIRTARTVIWNGPMGKYEVGKWEAGTKEVAQAIAESKGFKIVGGGDTIAALKKFGFLDKMDWVSCGGGAMLEFLARGTLPGIEALT